jgi:uncharacterized membrane protein
MQGRLTFLDALRGVALVLMVLNHTSHDWIDRSMGWPRYYLTYGTLLLPAPIFLFLVGFCLPISFHRMPSSERLTGAVVKYFRRGVQIIAAGFILNLIIKTEAGLAGGGVLQTIGLSIVLLGPAMPLLRHRAARWAILGVAALLYLSFGWSVDALKRLSTAHPGVARTLFNDFPPWPWIAPALVGLVLGWVWLEARSRGGDEEARYFTRVAWVSALALAGSVAWEWGWPSTPPWGFPRDYILNGHWTPRGATMLFVVGGVGALLVAAWRLAERGTWRFAWLVTLGQAALMLYFTHQLIERTLVQQVLQFKLNDWTWFAAGNVALLVACVYLGRGWLWLKRCVREIVAARGWPRQTAT